MTATTNVSRPEPSSSRRPARRGRARAFTLVELLVVVSIIGLLVAWLMPVLSSAKSVSRAAVCKHRLHMIGDAYAARTGDELAGEMTTFSPLGWVRQLLPYLAGETTVLQCPEAGEVNVISIEEQLEIRYYGSGFDYRLRLDGPYVAKMSDTQFQACKAAGYMHHGKVLARWTPYRGYVPDSNDNVVWFCIEEIIPESAGRGGLQSGDAAQDFEDVRMQVTDNEDGTFDLYFDLGSGGLDTDIINGVTGETLCVIPAGYPRADRSDGPFEGGFSHCTYGMNAATSSHRPAPGKILVLDYERSIARSSDQWSDPKFDPDGDGLPLFARHRGRLNVLFGDLSVRKMRPADINPVTPSVAEEYWETSSGH